MAESLTSLKRSIKACQHCAGRFAQTETAHQPKPIFQLSKSARLCIAGQAPGLRAHESGRPFTDPSGVRLRQWMGIGEDAFYDPARIAIAPMAFCFPGYNASRHDLPPPKECAALWRNALFSALPNIELIVTVGKSALAWHAPQLRSKSLTEIVQGGMLEGAPAILPLPHPSWRNNAWLKGNPWFDSETLLLLRAEVARLAG